VVINLLAECVSRPGADAFAGAVAVFGFDVIAFIAAV